MRKEARKHLQRTYIQNILRTLKIQKQENKPIKNHAKDFNTHLIEEDVQQTY
jgi:hypothetical protein